MTLVERVREALAGFGPMGEIEVPGGVLVEWDGDVVAGVENGVLRARVENGWATVTGDVTAAVHRATEVVLAECVSGLHEEVRAGRRGRGPLPDGLVRRQKRTSGPPVKNS